MTASPITAQSNNSASPAPGGAIGPGELSNFSLNGTVTRPADRPAVAPPQPQPRPATVTPAAPQGVRPTAPATDERPSPTRRPPAAESDLFRRPPTLPEVRNDNSANVPPPATDVSTPLPALDADDFSILPWIVGSLAIAGLAVLAFGYRRRRRVEAFAGQSSSDATYPDTSAATPSPEPADDPAQRQVPSEVGGSGGRRPLPTTLIPQPPSPRSQAEPAVQPRADPVPAGGIVSTGLRPWIEIDLIPDRASLDEQGTTIAFDVTLFNSGSAAARDVIVEARLLNAGAGQDQELGAFFSAPAQPGDPIPLIAPYARIPLRSAVRLSRADVREYEIEGRKLLVPLVAVSVRYRWSSGEGHSAAGFLVGQGGDDQEKLAPLRLDVGPRSWTRLGVRRYEKGLRS